MPAPLFFSVRLPTLLAKFWRAHFARESIAEAPDNSDSSARPVVSMGAGKEPRSFIIFRLDSLGDVVLTTPLFRELKRAYPQSRCTVVVQAAYKPLLVTNPHVDEILTMPTVGPAWLPQRAKRLVSAILLYCTQLRTRYFDFAISPRWDMDEHLATFLCLLTRASHRVGYSAETSAAKRRINRGSDAAFDICLPPGPAQHEVSRNLATLKALGAQAYDSRLEVRLTERDRQAARKLLENVPAGRRLIAIGIGARSPGRRWPLERYAKTVARLSQDGPVQPVIVCSADEGREAWDLAALLGGEVIIITGAPLRELCAVLERCHLFFGNDSGCAHLAAAMDRKTIVISRHPRNGDPNHFNSPVRFAPHCSRALVLQPDTGRDGCRAACCSAEAHCILGVSVEDAVAAARRMLREPRNPSIATAATAASDQGLRRLMQSHSAEAVQRAVEALRPGQLPLLPRA